MKYVYVLAIATAFVLAGCDDAPNRASRPETKEVEKTKSHTFSIERDLTNGKGPHTLYRIDNDEVTCYETSGEGGISCKWKNKETL